MVGVYSRRRSDARQPALKAVQPTKTTLESSERADRLIIVEKFDPTPAASTERKKHTCSRGLINGPRETLGRMRFMACCTFSRIIGSKLFAKVWVKYLVDTSAIGLYIRCRSALSLPFKELLAYTHLEFQSGLHVRW